MRLRRAIAIFLPERRAGGRPLRTCVRRGPARHPERRQRPTAAASRRRSHSTRWRSPSINRPRTNHGRYRWESLAIHRRLRQNWGSPGQRRAARWQTADASRWRPRGGNGDWARRGHLAAAGWRPSRHGHDPLGWWDRDGRSIVAARRGTRIGRNADRRRLHGLPPSSPWSSRLWWPPGFGQQTRSRALSRCGQRPRRRSDPPAIAGVQCRGSDLPGDCRSGDVPRTHGHPRPGPFPRFTRTLSALG